MDVEEREVSAERAQELVKEVLQQEFSGNVEKQTIIPRADRLNFACPYCGDSDKDHSKKRGNLYLSTMTYKCWNGGCETYRDFVNFLEDYNFSGSLHPMEKAGIINMVRDAKKKRDIVPSVSVTDLISNDLLECMVPRELLMEKMKLEEIAGSRLAVYLKKRQQYADKRFAGDSRRNRMFIFNMDRTGEYVMGLQIRNFDIREIKQGRKYMSYQLSKIWKDFIKNPNEEFIDSLGKLDSISTLFGLFHVDFSKMITLFEGPMDSFLFPNSIGLSGKNGSFPFDAQRRWFFDNDKDGKKKAMEKIAEGESVFLWKKFLDENDLHTKRIKDLNDLVIYLRKEKTQIKRLDNYFSEDKYDMIWI